MLIPRALRAAPRWAAVLVAVPGLTGCFEYVPARLESVPSGGSVRLRLSAPPAELAEASPEAGRILRGTLVRRASDRLYVRVPVAVRREGFATQAIAQEVAIAPADVVDVELRRRSALRTGLFVAGTAAVAGVVIGSIIQGHGNRALGTGEPPSELRAPLGF